MTRNTQLQGIYYSNLILENKFWKTLIEERLNNKNRITKTGDFS